MHRFFIGDPGRAQESPLRYALPGTKIILPEKPAHQVRDVLHLTPDEQIVLLDNSGSEFLCSVTKSSKAGVEVEVRERREGKTESSVRIILCQGLLKSARFEWILEKGTELGVAAVAPIICQRSLSGLEEAGASKLQRWQRILQEACEQCGRSRLPTLLPICSLMQALNDVPPGAIALMPWEEEQGLSLREALRRDVVPTPKKNPLTVILFIGPEGGLTLEEVQMAQRHGVQVVTLGQRILRAETAALATVANVMYELE
jgi:16S rRNA (uracil1498-N3)-methyltransferase